MGINSKNECQECIHYQEDEPCTGAGLAVAPYQLVGDCTLFEPKAVTYTLGFCDYGDMEQKPVRRLELSGGAGVYLCKEHWDIEMKFRKERNKNLHDNAKFDILEF